MQRSLLILILFFDLYVASSAFGSNIQVGMQPYKTRKTFHNVGQSEITDMNLDKIPSHQGYSILWNGQNCAGLSPSRSDDTSNEEQSVFHKSNIGINVVYEPVYDVERRWGTELVLVGNHDSVRKVMFPNHNPMFRIQIDTTNTFKKEHENIMSKLNVFIIPYLRYYINSKASFTIKLEKSIQDPNKFYFKCNGFGMHIDYNQYGILDMVMCSRFGDCHIPSNVLNRRLQRKDALVQKHQNVCRNAPQEYVPAHQNNISSNQDMYTRESLEGGKHGRFELIESNKKPCSLKSNKRRKIELTDEEELIVDDAHAIAKEIVFVNMAIQQAEYEYKIYQKLLNSCEKSAEKN